MSDRSAAGGEAAVDDGHRRGQPRFLVTAAAAGDDPAGHVDLPFAGVLAGADAHGHRLDRARAVGAVDLAQQVAHALLLARIEPPHRRPWIPPAAQTPGRGHVLLVVGTGHRQEAAVHPDPDILAHRSPPFHYAATSACHIPDGGKASLGDALARTLAVCRRPVSCTGCANAALRRPVE